VYTAPGRHDECKLAFARRASVRVSSTAKAIDEPEHGITIFSYRGRFELAQDAAPGRRRRFYRHWSGLFTPVRSTHQPYEIDPSPRAAQLDDPEGLGTQRFTPSIQRDVVRIRHAAWIAGGYFLTADETTEGAPILQLGLQVELHSEAIIQLDISEAEFQRRGRPGRRGFAAFETPQTGHGGPDPQFDPRIG